MTRALTLALVLAAACSTSPPPSQSTSAPAPTSAKDPAAARARIAAGAVVLDVRTAEEFAGGHLPGATHIPVSELPGRLGEVEALAKAKDAPIVVYCASGRRAESAHQRLTAAGYTQVTNGGGYGELR